MPYTFFIILFLNLCMLGTTGYVYYFDINLWQDQALLMSSLVGTITSGVTLLFFAVTMIVGSKKSSLKGALSVVFILAVFFAQLVCLGYYTWIK